MHLEADAKMGLNVQGFFQGKDSVKESEDEAQEIWQSNQLTGKSDRD